VRPPAHVFAAAAKEKSVASVSSCCNHQSKSYCEHHSSCCEEDKLAESRTWSIEFVAAIQARKCHGQAELWLTLGAVSPPPAKVVVSDDLIRGDILVIAADSTPGISQQPGTPPPRA
jgi:hypothetical protein